MKSLRVIAGAHRGRRLRAPRGLATRPTGARVREALFSILGDLAGSRVLDLYAGSGALGIEALSRGADMVVFVEHERAAVECIRENLAELGIVAKARVMPVTVSVALKSVGSEGPPPFDLVFWDPPWEFVDRATNELGPDRHGIDTLPVIFAAARTTRGRGYRHDRAVVIEECSRGL